MARVDVVEVECGDITSVEELHERLMEQLNFPGWYGKNWDAFWDAIVALVDMPFVLRLKNWSALEQLFPRDTAIMVKCLNEMSKQYPALASRVERT